MAAVERPSGCCREVAAVRILMKAKGYQHSGLQLLETGVVALCSGHYRQVCTMDPAFWLLTLYVCVVAISSA